MTAKPVPETPTLAVIGAGSWGTALAHLLGEKGHTVRLWVFEPEVYQELARDRVNSTFLPGVHLSGHISFTQDFSEALRGAQVIVMAAPSHVFRDLLGELAPHLPSAAVLLSATKGIETKTLLTMDGVVREILGAEVPYAVLGGPSFAREVAQKLPTAVTIACRDSKVAHRLQRFFSTAYFRVYTSWDVTGVELGGALKNIFAIGTGILEGMGLKDNSRAALITRGLAEMTRLGLRLGANPMTLAGLGGLGDLVLTCTSRQSRNFQVGLRLGQGETLDQILASTQMVAEGVKNARAFHLLAQHLGVEMPLVDAVYNILYEGLSPREAARKLMSRELKDELEAMKDIW
jgi:glycerol-3-phosphate dehydrogenase (NAD(P)+)|uniref:Glycerol-3-phosphate dehydrogenase [NAD(P)+] n=1 Tax=Desulfobacca acetoxidans TaxID=60893 RepID=A0A7V6A2J4_9BACT